MFKEKYPFDSAPVFFIRQPPQPSEWYAQSPFDPTLTFLDRKGRRCRYINTVLDETYCVVPPRDAEVRSLPPEEREVMAHLVVAIELRNKVSMLEIWWNKLFVNTRKTKVFVQASAQYQKLVELCMKSRAYRAVFCRLSTIKIFEESIKLEFKRIIEIADGELTNKKNVINNN